MNTNTNKLENAFIETMKENFKKDLEVYYDEEACLYRNYESLMQACERNISTIGFFNLANALTELSDGDDCAYYFTIRTRLIDECQNWLIGKGDKRITF